MCHSWFGIFEERKHKKNSTKWLQTEEKEIKRNEKQKKSTQEKEKWKIVKKEEKEWKKERILSKKKKNENWAILREQCLLFRLCRGFEKILFFFEIPLLKESAP